MTDEQINLLRSSLEKIYPISTQTAARFYGRLFEIAPDVRPLFKSDMPEQGRKLMATLASVINGLEHVPSMSPAVRNLGRRHVGYGVVRDHYEPVRAALMWALEEALGEDFTPELRVAWGEAYVLLSEIMLGGPPEA